MSSDELDIKPSASEVSSTSVAKFTSPPRQPKKRKVCTLWDVDGIDTARPDTFIAREGLVEKAMTLAKEHCFLVVGSPPGTGKSSLSQLMIEEILKANREANRERGKITGFYLRKSPKKEGFCLYKYVKEKTGVCFDNKTLGKELKDCSEVWLLFDDAQKLYLESCDDFWEDVVKEKKRKPFGEKTTVIVVVFATYYLSHEKSSPVFFKNQARLRFSDLLLSKDEARSLFERRCIYPRWENYFERLFYMTSGAAAAFTIAMNQITRRIQEVDHKSHRDEELSESEAMEDLVEKIPFGDLKRCFPVGKVDSVSHAAILDAIVNAYHVDMGETTEIEVPNREEEVEEQPVTRLIKAGILAETGRFTSPFAQRFYYQIVFPRAPSSADLPPTLDELIIQATQKLSARRLRVARQEINGKLQNPKEAVFQQLFHEAMASLLPVSYRIIPELGTKAEMHGKTVTGELDFYIRNGRKWALELLRDGKELREHLSRIPGKYRNVEATSWLVVDCRMNVTPRNKEENLCILVFEENYRSCRCYMRCNEPMTIKLAA